MLNEKTRSLVKSMPRTHFLGYSFQVQMTGKVNPFLTIVPFIEKSSSEFLVAKCDLQNVTLPQVFFTFLY